LIGICGLVGPPAEIRRVLEEARQIFESWERRIGEGGDRGRE